jgi:hypothetical protein
VVKALLLALAAASPQQFDLICTAPNGSAHYRIDLATGEWCQADCNGTMKLAGVTSTRITIRDEEPKFRGDGQTFISVDRVTGEWNSIWITGAPIRGSDAYKGTCEPAPFSGFGSEQRRF